MDIRTSELKIRRITFLVFIVGAAVVTFVIARAYKNRNKLSAEDCKTENEIAFAGRVTHYSSSTSKRMASFRLDGLDSVISIQRSREVMMIEDGDSIIKHKGENRYIVVHHRFGESVAVKNKVDTFSFECELK
ncbi:MAG TPA: hypothetical protein VHM26_04680 [Chitinophagaceae bacterium]|jgi:hypothetical protein|nr:hypothetical protein [Chitinophagaceae bacterium]